MNLILFFINFHLQLPDEEKSAEIFDLISNELNFAKFEHYETSAYAKKDNQCLHNLNYWNFGDYLGIGAGAHSKLSYKGKISRRVVLKIHVIILKMQIIVIFMMMKSYYQKMI